MRKVVYWFVGRGALPALLRILMFAPITSCQLSAQTTNPPITSASISSLRTALAEGGTTQLAFDGEIFATTPLIVSVDPTTIDASGSSVTISGTNLTRIFDVATNVHFTLINVTLTGGFSIGASGAAGTAGSPGTTRGGNGGPGGTGINGMGGALRNQGITVLNNCILIQNEATGGTGGAGGNGGNSTNGTAGNGGNGGNGGTGLGGAIYNLGTLTLTNCTVASNNATGGSGGAGGTNGAGSFAGFPGAGGSGAAGSGAAVYNLGTATIVDCTFNNNTSQAGSSAAGGGAPQGNGNGQPGQPGGASQGGAVCNLGTNMIINSTFDQNQANGGDGASGGAGPNVGGSGGNGGYAYGGSVYNAGTVNITNCTFAESVANGGTNGVAGGGSFPGNDGSPGVNEGDIIANNGGTFNLKNSILAFTVNGANPFRQTGTNAFGTITDKGFNLSSDATPAFTSTNSHNNEDALLTPLDANGGVTLTMALGLGSPATNAITDGSAPPLDQRGFGRVGLPDIGAFEFGAFSSNNFTVSGQVTMENNPFPGVTVKAGNGLAITDTNGNFSIVLPANTLAYSVAPQPAGFFSPPSQGVVLTANVSGVNFSATNPVAGLSNLMITNISTTTNATNVYTVDLSFKTIPNLTYVVQSSPNLTNWSTFATNATGTDGVFSITVLATNVPRVFFRAIPN